MKKIFVIILASSVFFLNSCAGDKEIRKNGTKPPPEELMAGFWNAQTGEEQQQAIKALIDSKSAPEDIESKLKKGRHYKSGVKTGWQIAENGCRDGKARPYHFYIPENYDPLKQHPVVIFLHGSTGTDGLLPEDAVKDMYGLWSRPGRAEEFIYIIPLTQRGAEWWTETGTYHIIDILNRIKQVYNADENRVFLSGFSDGGSGAYYLALYHNIPFAGFIPLNGKITVVQSEQRPIYLPNLKNKPLYVVNCGRDPLYPADDIKPFIDGMKKAGVPVTFKVYEDGFHSMSYWNTEEPLLIDFMRTIVRNPLPRELAWETPSQSLNRAEWMEINEIRNVNNNAAFEDSIVMVSKLRIKLGVSQDTDYQGEGAKIKEVQPTSPADKFKLKSGDIVTQIDDVKIQAFDDLARVVRMKRTGDKITFKVKRGDNEFISEGAFDEVQPQPAFIRKSPSARIEVKTNNNQIAVSAKNIAQYTVFISRDLFDLNKEITIYTNGEISFKGVVKPDIKFMLEQSIADNDRNMVFSGKIEIKVKPK